MCLSKRDQVDGCELSQVERASTLRFSRIWPLWFFERSVPYKLEALMNLNRRIVGKQLLDRDSFVGREAVNLFSKALMNLL